jgi:hypothetical protein
MNVNTCQRKFNVSFTVHKPSGCIYYLATNVEQDESEKILTGMYTETATSDFNPISQTYQIPGLPLAKNPYTHFCMTLLLQRRVVELRKMLRNMS